MDTSPSTSSSDVVGRFLAARRSGAYDDAARLVAPDAVWWSPISGPETGRRKVREMLERAEEDTDCFRSEVEGIEERGARVLAHVRNEGRRAGRELDSEQVLAFTVVDGLIEEVRIFIDDPEAVTAFWAAEA